MKPGEDLLEARGLAMQYPGVRALDGVDLRLGAGEALGLCGENGAGKSTLLKILSGRIPHGAFSGTLRWGGQPLHLRGPGDALAQGIRIIHQELALAPDLTVAENLFLGAEPRRWGLFIDKATQDQGARSQLDVLGLQAISTSARVGDLPIGLRQGVEIARALRSGGKLLIFDEPTSALSEKETLALLDLCLNLKAQGVALIYVSHKLDEVFRIADRIIVLRNGRSAGFFARVEKQAEGPGFDARQVATAMVGRSLNEVFPTVPPVAEKAEVLLETRHLHVTQAGTDQEVVRDLNIKVHAGEIVGLAGLLGAGRTETLEALFGLPRWRRQGEVFWRGQRVQKRPAGLALVPEDRRNHGLHTAMSIRFNHSLAALQRFSAYDWMLEAKERESLQASMQSLQVKAAHGEVETATLSGGNQQKVVLGKWLATQPQVLLLDDPTRGVDVGAKAEIYRLLCEWAAQGLGLILTSSENEEVLNLCHRIYVLREGRCVGEFSRGELTRESLVHLCAAPLSDSSSASVPASVSAPSKSTFTAS